MGRGQGGLRALIRRHPVGSFFVGAYAITWAFWLPAVLSDEREGAIQALFLIGVFGPWISAATVARVTTGSAREWMRSIFRFRLAKRWYFLPLLLPIAVIGVASLGMAAFGVDLDLSLLADERLAAFVPTLIFCLLINGGPEEPGWRGFALPRMQERRSPLAATLRLGPLWAFWHIPLLLISDEGIDHGLEALPLAGLIAWTVIGIAFGYVIFYTYLWNRTQSVVPCILLHAAFNTANGVLLLVPESQQEGGTYAAISLCLTSVVLIAAWALVYATKGRLGLPPETAGRRIAPTRYMKARTA